MLICNLNLRFSRPPIPHLRVLFKDFDDPQYQRVFLKNDNHGGIFLPSIFTHQAMVQFIENDYTDLKMRVCYDQDARTVGH